MAISVSQCDEDAPHIMLGSQLRSHSGPGRRLERRPGLQQGRVQQGGTGRRPPQQIKAMDDAWNAKSDAEKRDALSSGRTNDPKAAMDCLEVT
ncbi:hypothetical protein ACFWOY_16085 [Streptomyces sp. NPDC058423]|uniref:hypothetical protein n=1 Tax=unclassified Streptomyces TaxID=2593676 RepID=UPI00365456B0